MAVAAVVAAAMAAVAATAAAVTVVVTAAAAAATTVAAAIAGDPPALSLRSNESPGYRQSVAGLGLFVACRSGDCFPFFQLREIVQLIALPLAAAHLAHGMGGLQFAFAGFRQGVAQAASTQLRCPAMEAMEVSGPCHEHLLVVTPPV
jgi:hypothetical protein